MIPSAGYTFNTILFTGSRNSGTMVQTYLDDSSLRLMGMLMTISLGIFTILFLYVLYNMTVNVAGTTIAMLFFIALAFFIVLMKTFKLLGKFVSHSQPSPEFDSHSDISTISQIINHRRARHDSAPPPYEEAIKTCAIIPPVPAHNTVADLPFIVSIPASMSPPPTPPTTSISDNARNSSVQIAVE